jgi:hypothetical protein
VSRRDVKAARRMELVSILTDPNTELGPLDREDLLVLLAIGLPGADHDLVVEVAPIIAKAEAFIAPLEDEPYHEQGLRELLADLRRVKTKLQQVTA